MAIIKTLLNITPQIGENTFLAETAVLIGDVTIGTDCSIWYGTVLRGDVNSIRIGNRTNIQDNAVLHSLYKRSSVKIGDDVSIGHLANIHGAIIHNCVLVGMSAILLDNVEVGECSIIAAGSLVLSNTKIEPYSIYAGVPAKKIKTITATQAEEMILRNAKGYLNYCEWYRK